MAAGKVANIPALLPFPEANLRNDIPLDLWQVCLDSWSVLLKARLLLSDAAFENQVSEDSSLSKFLITFAEGLAVSGPAKHDARIQKSLVLGPEVTLLAHRLLVRAKDKPPTLVNWRFLAHVCKAFGETEKTADIVTQIWVSNQDALESSLHEFKSLLVQGLDSGKTTPQNWEDVHDLAFLMRKIPGVAEFIITGSDLVDSIAASYASLGPEARASAMVITFLGLLSLLNSSSKRLSLAYDVLYGIITPAETHGSQQVKFEIFMQDLVSKTPIISRLKKAAETTQNARSHNLLEKLKRFYVKDKSRRPSAKQQARRAKAQKAKGKSVARHRDETDSHMHDLTLITQLQDLFPDLGSAYIAKLLDHYDENIELITSHLLEDDIPPHLRDLDRTANIEPDKPTQDSTIQAAPSSPQRRNVYNDDAFDRLAADTSRIHLGRKSQSATADTLLHDAASRPSTKAAVLSALAAFDADDDERDDTYDLADVGGSVDAAKPDGLEATDAAAPSYEAALFAHWQATPGLFARDAATRRSPARAALRKDSGMTDEALEGWALMLAREPRRVRALEARLATVPTAQRALGSSAWHAGGEGESEGESEGERGGAPQRGGRGGALRGRGRGRGDVAGAPSERATQIARERKEKGKGARGNHNRKGQRARKTARAGFAE